jgi:hypothetical protein
MQYSQNTCRLQDAVRALMSTNKGRKSADSDMTLEHPRHLVEHDIENGALEDQGAELIRSYLMNLQPKTGPK